MKKIIVNAEITYEVVIGQFWAPKLLTFMEDRSRVAVIHSQGFKPELSDLRNINSELFVFEVPDGEDSKNPATLLKVWNWLGAAGFTRSDLIIGIGGGAITDLAGFVAATWLRGVDWIAVPTSLAGMVDASVGGKTGINSEYGKNLIGAFHSPIAVIIDPTFLETLSDRDFSAGMAEVIKCGFIADPEILRIVALHNTASLRQDLDATTDLIFRAISVKAKVVSADYKESFERESLNYGHTLGHAIEIHAKYQLRHGEAVSIGLVFAAELAFARGLIDVAILNMHRDLLSSLDLPISYPVDAWQKLAPLLALDKKARGKILRFVILNGLGSTTRLEGLSTKELDLAYERISL